MPEIAAPPLRRHVNYVGINALRGVAAVAVVAFHAWFAVQEHLGGGGFDLLRRGALGVDVFFVISGFVMVVSSGSLAQRRDGWLVFMERRLVRIVPMYWLITTAMLVLTIAMPHLVYHAAPTWNNVVSSYLFIPSHDGAGELRPVLADGWTLSFEMMFYIIFTIGLLTRINIYKLTVPIFAILLVVSLFRQGDWPGIALLAGDLPFEFVFGMIVGSLALRDKTLSPIQAALGIVASIACLLFIPSGPVFSEAPGFGAVTARVVSFGVPAMVLVASVVALEAAARAYIPRWVLALGDGSYSIYLSHSLVIAATAAAAARLGGRGHVNLFIAVAVVLACVFGLMLYYVIESPMQSRLKRALPRPKGAIDPNARRPALG